MMPISKEDKLELQKSLLDAFRTKNDLARMVRFAIDKNLDDLTTAGNLQGIAFELIEQSEAQGFYLELLKGAIDQSPDNPLLQKFIRHREQTELSAGLFEEPSISSIEADESHGRPIIQAPKPSMSEQRPPAFSPSSLGKGFGIMGTYTFLVPALAMVLCGLAGFIFGVSAAHSQPELFAGVLFDAVSTPLPLETPISEEEIDSAWPPAEGILNAVQTRGYLRCGIEGTLDLFSLNEGEIYRDEDGAVWYDDVTGFDADYCRVIAISVFGRNYNANSVRFVSLDTDNRFSGVLSGEVDVLVRNTTYTVGRGVIGNLEFAPTIFYDGQDLLVRDGIESLAELNNKRVCVIYGTTTKANLEAERANRQDVFFEIVDVNEKGRRLLDNDGLKAEFRDGNCDAISADRSQLVVIRKSVGGKILGEGLSKEPLAPVYISGDKQWGDIVDYSIFATIYAAELDISRENLSNVVRTETDLRIKQFLGVSDGRISNYLGTELGIDRRFVRLIIQELGNYKDIYWRNFTDTETGELIFPEHVNTIYDSQTGQGLLYSPPFSFPTLEELEQLK